MEIRIQLTEKDLFAFNMYHSYHRIQTWLFTILGIVIMGLSFTTYGKVDIAYTLLYFLAGVIFAFYTPINLRTSAKLAMKSNKPVSMAMKYRLDEKGIAVAFAEEQNIEQTDAASSIMWSQVFKVKETKNAFYLYTSPKNASIFPKDQLNERSEEFRTMIKKEVESYKI